MITLQYCFMKSTSKFWLQINKSGGGGLLIGFVKPTLYNIFSYIFLIGAIKHNVEKKFKICFILRDCLGVVSRKRTK